MEQQGIVSVWAGFFETEKMLMEYASEEGYDKAWNPIVSSFNQDFFGGDCVWPFDPDFWERALVAPTSDPEALVYRFSEGTTIGPALKNLFPRGLGKEYNAAILVYNYRYVCEENSYNPNAPVTFLAAVPYDEDES